MKKIYMLALLVVLGLTTNAQTEKKTWLLGGSVSFSANSYKGGGSNTTFSLSPDAGYFFAKNLAAGGMFNLTTGGGQTSWMLAPFVRSYFTDNKKGKPFAQVGLGVGGAGNGTTTSFEAKGGYAMFLNKSIALEMGAMLRLQTGVTQFAFGAGFQIHFAK
jgi:outer membrane protein